MKAVPAMVFSRQDYVPDFLDPKRSRIIQPSIDVFSPKNQELDDRTVQSILVHTGLLEGPPPEGGSRSFRRADGSTGYVELAADLLRLGRAPTWETPLVVQVSRWDPLKDAKGVIEGFREFHESVGGPVANLVLAGPNVHAVTDDPEGARVFEEVVEHWRALPHALRSQVHLAMLPMADREENAAIVNALQRHAAVVVQKSLREGFGLTVTEAMWKARPVLASAVGGIQDQIEDGVHGLLLHNPRDGHAFSGSLYKLLNETEFARRLGAAAHERARQQFIGIRHLMDYAQLVQELIGENKGG